ncbi:hypothetical protein KIPB_011528, partial [Kipferlia bialata]
GRAASFTLDLPHLRSIQLKFVTLEDSKGVGDSFSRCPSLEVMDSYKFWGTGTRNFAKIQVFVLPNCHTWSMMRSDDADYMDFYCPKMRQMELEGAYALKRVNLLSKPPAAYASNPVYKARGAETRFTLCLRDSCWPTGSIIGHPRLALCEPASKEEADAAEDSNPAAATFRQFQAMQSGGGDMASFLSNLMKQHQ